jgi:hypothetical protein
MGTALLTKEQALVKEIHSAFGEASDRLVAMANGGGIQLREKAERLKRLGFTSCEDVASFKRLENDKRAYELAQKYREKYPFLKFITNWQLDGICNKYGLVAGSPEMFTGSISVQKLSEMEYWFDKIDEEDKSIAFFYAISFISRDLASKRIHPLVSESSIKSIYHGSVLSLYNITNPETSEIIGYVLKIEGGKMLSESGIMEAFEEVGISGEVFMSRKKMSITECGKKPALIAAPAAMLWPASMFEPDPNALDPIILQLDPIILQPVIGGYLVLAKWGPEANDPELVIPELN